MAAMPPNQASAGPPGAESIEELFAALESPLLRYALRLVGERSLAEDIVQESFMRLHAQFDEVREPGHWLYRTVHNLALNQRRRSSKIVPLEQPDNDGPTPEMPDPQPLPDEQIARLARGARRGAAAAQQRHQPLRLGRPRAAARRQPVPLGRPTRRFHFWPCASRAESRSRSLPPIRCTMWAVSAPGTSRPITTACIAGGWSASCTATSWIRRWWP